MIKIGKKGYTPLGILWIIVEYVSLIFFGLCAVVPVISCVITAFKTSEEYQQTNVMTLPESWLNFDNFTKAFEAANMGRAFLNSVIVMVCVLIVSVILGTQLAYVLNRFKFPGNTLIRNLYLFASLLPAVAMQVTVFNIMSALHLVNSLVGYIIMMCGTDVISIYIFIQFMENIPVSLDESAIIDGASYWTIYWKIMLPLLKPAIVTSCILKGVGVYNEYYCANLYLMDKKLHTIARCLYTFVGPMGSQYNLIRAGVIISLLPALIVFILCQKQIYSGIAAGAENKEEGEYGFSRKAFRRFIARRYDMDGLQKLALETKEHLCSTILPFWKSLRDNENGGYYGYMDFDLNLDKKAEKGCILNSRITWFFANAYMILKDESLKDEASHGFEFMKNYCFDKENGGVFWSVNYDGTPRDTTKHTYNQAFSIYALSSYYDATGDKEALKLAEGLFYLIETKCRDKEGYLEAFDQTFSPAENDILSENGVIAERTMNTLLHVLEAYTELYRVNKSEEVKSCLHWILDTVAEKI